MNARGVVSGPGVAGVPGHDRHPRGQDGQDGQKSQFRDFHISLSRGHRRAVSFFCPKQSLFSSPLHRQSLCDSVSQKSFIHSSRRPLCPASSKPGYESNLSPPIVGPGCHRLSRRQPARLPEWGLPFLPLLAGHDRRRYGSRNQRTKRPGIRRQRDAGGHRPLCRPLLLYSEWIGHAPRATATFRPGVLL